MKATQDSAHAAASSAGLAIRLWREFLGRYWPRLGVALIAMGVYAASASAIPIGVEWINAGFAGGDGRFSPSLQSVQIFGPLIIVALGAVNAAAQYTQTRLSAGAALGALRDIQNAMFDKLTRLDYAQIRGENIGQHISRFTNDTMVLRESLTRATTAVRDLLTLIGLCLMMLWYDWMLFLVVALIYPVIGVPVARIGKILRRISSNAQSQAGDLASLVNESVAGARMVKTYQIEPLERARAAQAFDDRLGLLKRMAYARALNEPFIFFAGSVALALVISIVAMRISAGALSIQEFISFIIALLLMSQPARGLGTLNAVLQEGFGAFERMTRLLDTEPTIVSAPGAPDLSAGSSVISVRDVGFSYGDGDAALNGVSCDIEAGVLTALVGASGAGKSTLFNLLTRLYDPSAGAIMVGGADIRNVSLRSLRSQMALVSQDAVIFNMSALENIAFGNPAASRADIIRAAEAAAANDFIAALPHGYDTPLGEGGSRLSGGQKQRIAIARAFLKDAPILLLDEATSALDAESEARIQEAIARLAAGRTTIAIAHRLSTIRQAAKIIYLKDGRVAETGTHDELIAAGGDYARQAALQFRE